MIIAASPRSHQFQTSRKTLPFYLARSGPSLDVLGLHRSKKTLVRAVPSNADGDSATALRAATDVGRAGGVLVNAVVDIATVESDAQPRFARAKRGRGNALGGFEGFDIHDVGGVIRHHLHYRLVLRLKCSYGRTKDTIWPASMSATST